MAKRSFSEFDWDEGNREKCTKHGVSIEEIEYVLAHAETLVRPDSKSSTHEERMLAIGISSEGRFTFVVFTPRLTRLGLRLRPISARYMHEREIKKYAKEIARAQKR